MIKKADNYKDKPITIEELLKKLKRRQYIMVVGYFMSLIFMGICFYMLQGIFGALIVLSGFSTYFFHLNMRNFTYELEYQKQRMQATKGHPVNLQLLEKSKETITPQQTGQYL